MVRNLSVKEATQFTGKSESTIKRLIREITADPNHADRHSISPSHEEVEKRRDAGDPLEPIEDRIAALIDAIESTEDHVATLGFDWSRFENATGFDRIEAIKDAVEVVRSTEDDRRRYEILAMEVIKRFRALNMAPSVYQFAERRDNIEAIYKKVLQKRTVADVTEILKELHKIVNEAKP